MSKNTRRAKKPTILTFREVYRLTQGGWTPGAKEAPLVKEAVRRKQETLQAERAALQQRFTARDLCCSGPALAKRLLMSERFALRAQALAVQDGRVRDVQKRLQSL